MAAAFMVLPEVKAQTPTFSENIATILYSNCTSCHRSGGIGPFELQSFSDAVNNAQAIKTAITSGAMPPWPPDTTYSRFAHERTLTQQQIAQIVSWVDGNTPQGNPASEPAVPVFSTNSQLSQPASATYTIPTYTVTSNQDDYRAFVLPNLSTITQAVTEIEFMPANKSIVHHILVYYDTSGICQQLDDADPLPGYTAFGGIGNGNAKQIGGWVPGSPAVKLPGNFGMPAYKNGKYVMQIHYAPGSAGQKDSTRFSVVYKPITPTMREVYQVPILNHLTNLTNGPLYLLPNQKKKFIESQGLPIPISVLGITPHMHLIGRDKKVFAIKPGATDTTRIIRIKDWNFNWQGQYMFKKLMLLPMGTLLRSESVYDNTADNPYNPSSPPVAVSAGESTLNEMMLTYFMFVTTHPGDEGIILDSTGMFTSVLPRKQTADDWNVYPNPAHDALFVVRQTIEEGLQTTKIEVVDALGRTVQMQGLIATGDPFPGSHRISIGHLPKGLYSVRIHRKNNGLKTIGFIKD